MFEHLDDPRQREHDLEAEYGAVAVISARMRRRRGVVVTSLALSLVATGGVSGLAMGQSDLTHLPLGPGPLFALGDPSSPGFDLPPTSLTASERTPPGICPSPADRTRPTSSAAVPVAVTDAVVVSPDAVGGSGPSGSSGPATFSLSSVGRSASASPPAHGSPRPVAGTPPTTPHPPSTQPPTTGGGGVVVPVDPSTPPVTVTPDPTGDPTAGTGDGTGGGDTTGGTVTPTPTDSGDPGTLIDQVLTP